MSILQMVLIPVIGALIGYCTNVIALRMLFWPREPVILLGIKLQGLLPRRQAEIAQQLGALVENELMLVDQLMDKINTPEMQERIIGRLVETVELRLYELLPKLVPSRVTRMILDAVEKILRQESPAIMDSLLREGQAYLLSELRVSKIVEDKINSYDLKELEDLVKGLSMRELTFIEVLGGIIGFLVGLIQLAVLYLLSL